MPTVNYTLIDEEDEFLNLVSDILNYLPAGTVYLILDTTGCNPIMGTESLLPKFIKCLSDVLNKFNFKFGKITLTLIGDPFIYNHGHTAQIIEIFR